MENSGKWKVEKSLYNNPKIAIEKESRNCNRKEKEEGVRSERERDGNIILLFFFQ